jgi:hypothetical protein
MLSSSPERRQLTRLRNDRHWLYSARIRRESSLSRGLAEKSLRGIGKRVGELTVLHELADMAIEGSANRREFGKLNVPPADLNPVIGQTRHSEHAARRFLGEP